MKNIYSWLFLPLTLLLVLGLTACPSTGDDDDSGDDDDTSDDDDTTDDDDTVDDDDDSAPVGFQFNDTDFGDYDRVDRMGMPAVATALILPGNKDAYNAANPTDDVNADFVGDIVTVINLLHHGTDPADGDTGLDDDLLALDLTPCTIDAAGAGSCVTVGASLILPDTLKIDTSADAGFPNGRALADPVIDITLAVLLLELLDGTHDGSELIGSNPPANDVEFQAGFPYLAPAH